MNHPSDFQYERFRALSGSELVAYMEPLINDPSIRIPSEVIERMILDLPTYDDDHLVYALELLGYNAPERITPHVPRFLAHPSGSVRCAASRILQHLPDGRISRDLVDSVRGALASYAPDFFPGREFFASVLEDLERRRVS
jgi:hypothetical protein